MPIRMLKKDEDTKREKGLKKSKMLSGGQVKLDKNKDGKISGEDFKMMKKKQKIPQQRKIILNHLFQDLFLTQIIKVFLKAEVLQFLKKKEKEKKN